MLDVVSKKASTLIIVNSSSSTFFFLQRHIQKRVETLENTLLKIETFSLKLADLFFAAVSNFECFDNNYKLQIFTCFERREQA